MTKKTTKFQVRILILILIFLLFITPFNSIAGEPSQQWRDKSLSAHERTELLLENMTIDQKVQLVTGNLNHYYGLYNEELQELGIPALKMAEPVQSVLGVGRRHGREHQGPFGIVAARVTNDPMERQV